MDHLAGVGVNTHQRWGYCEYKICFMGDEFWHSDSLHIFGVFESTPGEEMNGPADDLTWIDARQMMS